jgi:rSAM/selenodomain-associated transferase 1
LNSRTDRVVVVFAKRPAPGTVKTRMCPPFTPEQAAALYAAMLDDVLETTAAAAEAAGAAAWLAVHPSDALGELAARHPGFRAVPQCGADLAQRMERAVSNAAAAGFTAIVLRGSDNPALPASAIAAGLAALDEVDLAVGPDRDGGYGWIALRGPAPGLFDHPMSTGSVLTDTLARAAALGLRVRTLASHFDLDTAADLRWLAAARLRGEAADCPRTLAFLDEQRLWP